jgi:hypothetical protein
MEIPFNFFCSFFIFVVGLGVVLHLGGALGLKRLRCSALYLWHTLFCVLYIWYSLRFGSDAIAYYDNAMMQEFEVSAGTDFVTYLVSLCIDSFDLSLICTFLVFNILGSVGLIFFDVALYEGSRESFFFNKEIRTVIVFLPSISYWSSAIGKDVFSFLSLGITLWAVGALSKRWGYVVVGVGLMYLVRPHIAVIMVMAFALSVLFCKSISNVKKILILLIVSPVVIFLLDVGLEYSGVAGGTIGDLLDYVQSRQSINLDGVSSIDISEMNIFEVILSYMFRPLFGEVKSYIYLAGAIENTILIFFFSYGILILFMARWRELEMGSAYLFIYSFILCFVLSATTANLGLAMRQKWMFIPVFMYLILSARRR